MELGGLCLFLVMVYLSLVKVYLSLVMVCLSLMRVCISLAEVWSASCLLIRERIVTKRRWVLPVHFFLGKLFLRCKDFFPFCPPP